MQEIFKAFEQEHTAGVRIPPPPAAPGPPSLSLSPDEDMTPIASLPNMDWWFMNDEVTPGGLMGAPPGLMGAPPGLRLPGAPPSSADLEVDPANNAFLFPPLPIVSPNYVSSNFK
jgi:hypothetical protein